jgi:hypothetical protein
MLLLQPQPRRACALKAQHAPGYVRWKTHFTFKCLCLLKTNFAAAASVAAAGNRNLQQAAPEQVINYNPLNRSVTVSKSVFLPSTNIPGAIVDAIAEYPDPVLENPDGWRFKVKSNASVVLGSTTTAAVRINSLAQSKLAPAIALSSADLESPGSTILLNQVSAKSRPGLLTGVTMAKTDAKLVSTAPFQPELNISNGAVLMFSQQQAESGRGQAINLVNVEMEGKNVVIGDSRGKTWANRWYFSPSHAINGQVWKLKGGQVGHFSQNRARASQGTATSGLLHVFHGFGNIHGRSQIRKIRRRSTRFLAKNGAISRADNRAFVDAGAAQAGNIQLLRSDNGDTTMVGLSQARVAEGNAAAGAVNVGWAENGYVYVGDYWEELSNPGNAVVSTNYGRGPAQAGQINIALSPNSGTRIGGTTVATAVQGPATSGAFTLTNGFGELQTDQDVVAITSEYTAAAGNLGVSVARSHSDLVNTAVAKTDTGSAIAFDAATAVVGTQNSAISSATATTSTGQAASMAASQAIGAVQSETQGSSLAKTTTGNALSSGSAISGSMYTARGVSTSAATTQDGAALSAGLTGVVSADSEAASASSAVTSGQGNAASVAQAYGLGIFQGKGTAASSAGAREGSTASLALGVGTGLILSDSNVASTAQTADGNAMATSGSLAIGGIQSTARATSLGQSGTGNVESRADAVGIGSLHGEAKSSAVSATGCADCVSDAVANAVSVGLVADSSAAAKADSPINPGNSLANAMAFGYISRTSNGGSSRIAIGPGQALTGGFAISAPRRVADAAAAAAAHHDLARKAAAVRQQQQQQQLPSLPEPTTAGEEQEYNLQDFLVKPSTLHLKHSSPPSQQQQQQQQKAAEWPRKPQPLSLSRQQAQPAAAAAATASKPAVAGSLAAPAPDPVNIPEGLQQLQQQQLSSRRFGSAAAIPAAALELVPASPPPAAAAAGKAPVASSRRLFDPQSLPGAGFLASLLQKLDKTVAQAQEVHSTQLASGFTANVEEPRPMYEEGGALEGSREDMQENERRMGRQQRQQ